MIIDCHTHAWTYWPYQPEVPDPESRGRAGQLLWEMDRVGVDRAVLVNARIDHNPENNEYGLECALDHPDRFVNFADVDCSWWPTYHQPGAAARLAEAAEKYRLKGFTQYLKDDYGYFETAEGTAFLEKAAELELIVSFALGTAWQEPLRRVARRFPGLVFLCHHMAGCRAAEGPPYPSMLELLESAEVPNIYLKLSGFHYVSQVGWDYPYPDAISIVRTLYAHFGPERLCWASDYPVVLPFMTYRQSLEAVRTHCSFIRDRDMDLILGDNMARLLGLQG